MKMTDVLIFLFALTLSSCFKENGTKQIFEGFEPIYINDDWQLSDPETENINRDLLHKAYNLIYDEKRYVLAKSLLVFRNGKLVAEAYPSDKKDYNRLNNIQSITKSVTSILTGCAIQEGVLDSQNQKLYDIYPELFDDDILKREIKISDALTMQSGINFNNNKHTQKLYSIKSNSVQFILSLDRKSEPGQIASYNDGDPHLISKAIEKESGQTLSDFANCHLFQKLKIDDWQWEAAKDGTTFGAFSLFLKPRDLGKIGQLLLQKGIWNNEQLANYNYLNNATSQQVFIDINHQPYGYYFWIYPKWNAYASLGHGGQFLFIAPDKNLVIVYTAWPYTNSSLWDNGEQLMSIIYESCE